MDAPKEQQAHAKPAKDIVLLYRTSATGGRSRVELFAAGDGGSLIMVGASVFGYAGREAKLQRRGRPREGGGEDGSRQGGRRAAGVKKQS